MGLENYIIIFILILFIIFSGCVNNTETDIQQNIQQDIKIIPTPTETTLWRQYNVGLLPIISST